MRQVKVLLVEDHDFTRATVAAALRSENMKVVAVVPTARDAMRAVAEHEVDCAVLDLNLGFGPTGLDLAHRLREHDPEIGIVLLTTFKDPRLLASDQRPLPVGSVYLIKDNVRSTNQLREAIDNALSNSPRTSGQSTGRISLTDTQMEILRMIADGLTNAEIAQRRGVTARSVQTAMTRILANAPIELTPGADSRVQLVNYYHALTGSPGVN
jgi:DNA-binding NarL/FixJ family response regulator